MQHIGLVLSNIKLKGNIFHHHSTSSGIIQYHLTSPNTTQYYPISSNTVSKRAQHVASDDVGPKCWPRLNWACVGVSCVSINVVGLSINFGGLRLVVLVVVQSWC